ncbi:carotenoid ester lipase precursor [Trametes versicolor FP-101664 SS1]|uniref:carotenoid ester lipase precursor n=1 Tax=Trametes versicolor (strain FP-101664) TaxID=717944 RepID=UPI00046223C8|nr:carotenoid ester lipase precursor [Trametes versicolor FP-101664 SS1]EIW58877.1 carotenoid ester lipase precursor [Trametes versicolor FP-101664 SS1]
MALLIKRLVYATPLALAAAASTVPTVTLDEGTIVGTSDGFLDQFLGIPFAQPPVGKLRLQLPVPVSPYSGIVNATAIGNQCFQQALPAPPVPSGAPSEIGQFLQAITASEGPGAGPPQSEDCLNINVIVPSGTQADAKLPVAAWIYGGGFQVGSNVLEPGAVVANRSAGIGLPVIFVAMNYRLSAFGFLGGKEVKEAGVGNLGLQDQREALRWIQKYISNFGGDPTKVTIWGESAGGISVAHQMAANGGDTEGLFRAAWMESGSLYSNGDIEELQPTFDFIASEAGCASAEDPLACLREVPAEVIVNAMDKTSTIFSADSLNIPYFPHVDGVFIKGNTENLTIDGKIANVPFINGANEDEGTLFSLAPLPNVTTEEDFAEFVKNNYFPRASNETIARILELYPADPAAGSPFGTGDQFAFNPVYKRLSAFQGDLIFHGPRRFMLEQLSGKQVARSYLSERSKIPGLGAAHSTELGNIFGPGDMTDYFVRFVHTLNPNSPPGNFYWPEYTPGLPQLLTFVDGNVSLKVTTDTFREGAIQFLTDLSLEQPF